MNLSTNMILFLYLVINIHKKTYKKYVTDLITQVCKIRFFFIFYIEVVFNAFLFVKHDSGFQNCLARLNFEKSGAKTLKNVFLKVFKICFLFTLNFLKILTFTAILEPRIMFSAHENIGNDSDIKNYPKKKIFWVLYPHFFQKYQKSQEKSFWEFSIFFSL